MPLKQGFGPRNRLPSFRTWFSSFKHAEKLRRVALGIQQELDVALPLASFQHLSNSRSLLEVLKEF